MFNLFKNITIMITLSFNLSFLYRALTLDNGLKVLLIHDPPPLGEDIAKDGKTEENDRLVCLYLLYTFSMKIRSFKMEIGTNRLKTFSMH